MDRLLAIVVVALLAGCSSEGRGPLTDAVLERVGALLPGGEDEATATAPPPPNGGLTRAMIEQAGVTMIRTGLVAEEGRFIMSGVAVNGGHVTYASRFGQTVAMRGSLVTGTRGIGYDLLAVATSPNDPIVRPTPLSDWPGSVSRTYQYPGIGPEGERLAVTCNFAPQGEVTIEIVETVYQTLRIIEDCTGDVSFRNEHFADTSTGLVWKSQQWLGPNQGALALEVLEPLTSE